MTKQTISVTYGPALVDALTGTPATAQIKLSKQAAELGAAPWSPPWTDMTPEAFLNIVMQGAKRIAEAKISRRTDTSPLTQERVAELVEEMTARYSADTFAATRGDSGEEETVEERAVRLVMEPRFRTAGAVWRKSKTRPEAFTFDQLLAQHGDDWQAAYRAVATAQVRAAHKAQGTNPTDDEVSAQVETGLANRVKDVAAKLRELQKASKQSNSLL